MDDGDVVNFTLQFFFYLFSMEAGGLAATRRGEVSRVVIENLRGILFRPANETFLEILTGSDDPPAAVGENDEDPRGALVKSTPRRDISPLQRRGDAAEK